MAVAVVAVPVGGAGGRDGAREQRRGEGGGPRARGGHRRRRRGSGGARRAMEGRPEEGNYGLYQSEANRPIAGSQGRRRSFVCGRGPVSFLRFCLLALAIYGSRLLRFS